MAALQITTRVDGVPTIVELVGTLNLATSPDFTARLGELLRDGHHRLVLDAADLWSVDPTGVQTLTCTLARVRAAGGTLVIARASPEVAALLSAGSGATRLALYASLTGALQAAASAAG